MFYWWHLATVDEKLAEQGVLPSGKKLSDSGSNSPLLTFEEYKNRARAISEIEGSDFMQTSFMATKSKVSHSQECSA